MTSRERILTALDHREPDRCPTYLWIDDACLERLADTLGVEDQEGVERELGIDRWRQVEIPVGNADGRKDVVRRFVPKAFRALADGFIHENGIVERIHPGARYLEDLIWHPLQEMRDAEELSSYPFAGPEHVAHDPARGDDIRRIQERDAVVFVDLPQPFKTAWHLRGMENLFCDFLQNPVFVDALYDRLYAVVKAQAVEAARAGVDVVEIVGDIAMQDRLMMSPATWRRFDKPRLAEVIQTVKRIDDTVRVYMHSDGAVTEIVPDLVEIGLDILNPLQPECMDPFALKKAWGDRLVLHGGVSVQRTIPLGTPRDVRDEVRRLVDGCAPGGGFVLGPSNVLISEFPMENIITMYQTACVG